VSRILVLAEHRKGVLRDITREMLTKGRELAGQSGGKLAVAIPGKNVDGFATELSAMADEVFVINDDKLENFNGEIYRDVMTYLMDEYKPLITLIGHTAAGMELAPALAVARNLPVTTDCIDVKLDGNKLTAVRQMYGGKINSDVFFNPADQYLLTMRQGVFAPSEGGTDKSEISNISCPLPEQAQKKFVEYIDAVAGAVDITAADVLVSVGQGIGDEKNIPIIEDFAAAINATMSCSRPVVDRKWLPKERQVGSSGKTVKPKVYFAIGISGAFQHVTAVKADTIVAVNKDPRAPIFRVADYGYVGDLFQVIPKLKEKVMELRSGK
jgi:electron transfer flavoprotein alpha subunit